MFGDLSFSSISTPDYRVTHYLLTIEKERESEACTKSSLYFGPYMYISSNKKCWRAYLWGMSKWRGVSHLQFMICTHCHELTDIPPNSHNGIIWTLTYVPALSLEILLLICTSRFRETHAFFTIFVEESLILRFINLSSLLTNHFSACALINWPSLTLIISKGQ